MNVLTEEYKSKLNEFESFRVKVEGLVRDLLIQNKIHFNTVESRIKDFTKLEEKIVKKEGKYSNLEQITDLVGLRIITYFEDEVDKIAKIIEKEFQIDKENSIDKRVLETDRFGYKSLHYVASLISEREKLTEYKRFAGIKVEIQIRSTLQHAWAEIEHDIGYKGENSVPDSLKRNFSRVAALLEVADIEFVKIKNELKIYELEVEQRIKNNPEGVGIDAASLKSYILSDSTSLKIDKQIATRISARLSDPDQGLIESQVEKIHFLNIKSIKVLDNLLLTYESQIIEFACDWLGSFKNRRLNKGISIFYLAYILVKEKNDEEFMKNYITNFLRGNDPISVSKRIISTYEKTKKHP